MHSEPTLDDIVFEGRNKDYGAFLLRKRYGKYTGIAITVSVLIFCFLILIPKISEWLSKSKVEDNTEIKVDVDLSNIKQPDIPKDEAAPPPPKIEIPKIDKIKFLPPVVKPPDQVPPDEDIPDQDDLDKSNPGDETQKGDPNLDETLETIKGGGDDLLGLGNDDQVYVYVQEMPEFPGGRSELVKFFNKHVTYPQIAQKKELEGLVQVMVIIDKEGNITEPQILKGVDASLDQEALRVVKMMPKWKPGKNNGYNVRVKTVIPVNFKLPPDLKD